MNAIHAIRSSYPLTSRVNGRSGSAGALRWSGPARAVRPRMSQVVIDVQFEGTGGERWSAIGGGASLAEAIRFARDSSPAGLDSTLVGWNELYGE